MYPNILRFDMKFRTLCSAQLKKVRFHNSSVLANAANGKVSLARQPYGALVCFVMLKKILTRPVQAGPKSKINGCCWMWFSEQAMQYDGAIR